VASRSDTAMTVMPNYAEEYLWNGSNPNRAQWLTFWERRRRRLSRTTLYIIMYTLLCNIYCAIRTTVLGGPSKSWVVCHIARRIVYAAVVETERMLSAKENHRSIMGCGTIIYGKHRMGRRARPAEYLFFCSTSTISATLRV